MTLPETRQLKIFIALEETRSFTSAAKRCEITQSAVSHAVKAMEKQLDCALIERVGKRFNLTPYGEVFLHHAKRVVRELEASMSKIETLRQWGYSSIRIGAPDSICQYVLPKVLEEFGRRNSKCEVFVSLGDTRDVQRLLSEGLLDLAFGIHLSPHDQRYNFTPISQDELCFITSKDHLWCKNRSEQPRKLQSERLITYGEQSETQRLISKHFSENAVQHYNTMMLGNMEAIKEMTRLELGVGIVPRWVAKKELKGGTLIEHAISSPPPKRHWGIFSLAGKRFTLPEEELVALCKVHLDQAVDG